MGATEPLPLAARVNGSPTGANLAKRYLEEHVAVRLKPTTQERVRIVLRRHILPALGKAPLMAAERAQVVEPQYKLCDRPVTANKAVKVLAHMYPLSEGWGIPPEACNPCRPVEKYPERRRERFLSDAEFARLGRALDEAVESGSASPTAAAAIDLLMLTGGGKSEVLTLRCTDVDLEAGEIRLADSKTGAKIVHLGDPAIAVLRDLAHEDGNPWVITSPKPGEPLSDVYDQWHRIRCRAGIKDVRLHDLRHNCASLPYSLAA